VDDRGLATVAVGTSGTIRLFGGNELPSVGIDSFVGLVSTLEPLRFQNSGHREPLEGLGLPTTAIPDYMIPPELVLREQTSSELIRQAVLGRFLDWVATGEGPEPEVFVHLYRDAARAAAAAGDKTLAAQYWGQATDAYRSGRRVVYAEAGFEVLGTLLAFATPVPGDEELAAANWLGRAPRAANRVSPDIYRLSLPTKLTPGGTPASAWEIANTGGKNFLLEGGGAQFWADGVIGTTIQEAKFIGKPSRSPFIVGSDVPVFIRQKILSQVDDEFARMGKIIGDSTNPLRDVEVIVSDPAANQFFIDMLKKSGLDGRIINR
jgi:hypothetical protein